MQIGRHQLNFDQPTLDSVPGLGRKSLFMQQLTVALAACFLPAVGGLIGLVANDLPLTHPTLRVMASVGLLLVMLTVANDSLCKLSFVSYTVALRRSMHAMAITASLLFLILFAFQMGEQVSRISIVVGLVATTGLLVTYRIVLIRFNQARTGRAHERILVVEDSRPIDLDVPHSHVRLCGFDVQAALATPERLDTLGQIIMPMDRVVVSTVPERRSDWARMLASFDVRVEVVDETTAALGAFAIDRIGANHTLVTAGPSLRGRDRAIKRTFDVVVSIVALIALSPIFLATIAAIALEDGRPIFFRQKRIGRDNRTFDILKFRSMSAALGDASAERLTQRGDPRVTRVGRFIRATSIDELPQFINVLRGEMSVVGPRPHAAKAKAGEKYYWEVDERYWRRHRLKPGVTGLAQVRGYRGATDREEHLESRLGSDLEYLHNWHIGRDLRILLATARVLVHPQAF